MANVIKHKRGSGSDPGASDLILGELAIRTDTGKLFTKMDSGAIAEIAGGGSDIAINTLSSSSGTGGGSATFNGSAYRFTLSAPPNVSAAQLLVSINGVIQKPVAGTGQPSEGFSVDGTDIILGDAPATGSDFFILTFKSLGVSEPADNSVTSAKIVDGAIVNADINASAAIAASKIADFVSNNSNNRVLTATGTTNSLNGEANLTFDGTILEISNATPKLKLTDSDATGTPEAMVDGSGGDLILHVDKDDEKSTSLFAVKIDGSERMRIDSSGRLLLGTSSTPSAGVQFDIKRTTDTTTYSASSNHVNGLKIFNDSNTDNGFAGIELAATDSDDFYGSVLLKAIATGTNYSNDFVIQTRHGGNYGERLRIDSSGRLNIGTDLSDSTMASVAGLVNIHTTNTGTHNGLTLFWDHNNTTTDIEQRIQFSLGDNASADSYVNAGYIAIGKADTWVGNPNRSSYLSFATSNAATQAERMRIDSSGRLLIGSTDATVADSSIDDLVVGSTANGKNDGITIVSGTAQNGTLAFADSGGATQGLVGYVHNGDYLRLHAGNTLKVRIDTDGLKFNSDTAAANALDDYEEGTFSFSESNITVSNLEAKYTKMGRVVMLSARINFGSSSNTSTLNLTGLPFTPDSGAGNSTCGGVIPEQNVGLGALFMAVEHGNNTVRIRKDNGQVVNPSNMSGKQIRFVLHYIAAS